jgi:hypothetical protein
MSFHRKRKSETELNMPLIRNARNQSADEKSDQIKDQTSKVPSKIKSVKCTFCERSSLIKIKTFNGALKHNCGQVGLGEWYMFRDHYTGMDLFKIRKKGLFSECWIETDGFRCNSGMFRKHEDLIEHQKNEHKLEYVAEFLAKPRSRFYSKKNKKQFSASPVHRSQRGSLLGNGEPDLVRVALFEEIPLGSKAIESGIILLILNTKKNFYMF